MALFQWHAINYFTVSEAVHIPTLCKEAVPSINSTEWKPPPVCNVILIHLLLDLAQNWWEGNFLKWRTSEVSGAIDGPLKEDLMEGKGKGER